MIKTVILWTNGNVIVFDENGKQLPEFQRRGDHAYRRILEHSNEDVTFEFGVWQKGTLPITKEQFKIFAQAPFDQMECWQRKWEDSHDRK